MATASISTVDAILKEYYIGPLQQQLNDEIMCLELFEKAKVSWAGRQAIVPVHTGRNSGVGFKSEGTALPGAGSQEVNKLTVTAKYLYGRMQVSGQAIASAAKGGTASFVGALELEMDGLKDDVRNRSDESCVSGGTVVAFIHNTTIDIAAEAAATGVKFEGNGAKIKALEDAGELKVKLVCCSNNQLGGAFSYKYLTGAANFTGTEAVLEVTATNPAAGTFTLTAVAGGSGLDTQGVPDGYAMAVVVNSYTASTSYDPTNEPVGIFGNLAGQSLFGVNRELAHADNGETLQSVILEMGGDGDGNREALTLERMQEMLDSINVTSGQDVDLIMCNPAMRAKYIGLLTGTVQMNAQQGAQKGDGGFLGLSFANIPIKTGRHVPQGVMIFLSTSTWRLAVLEDGKMADLDGSVLSRVAGKDEWEAFYKWYYNHYCYRPGANGILTGIICGTLAA